MYRLSLGGIVSCRDKNSGTTTSKDTAFNEELPFSFDLQYVPIPVFPL